MHMKNSKILVVLTVPFLHRGPVQCRRGAGEATPQEVVAKGKGSG